MRAVLASSLSAAAASPVCHHRPKGRRSSALTAKQAYKQAHPPAVDDNGRLQVRLWLESQLQPMEFYLLPSTLPVSLKVVGFGGVCRLDGDDINAATAAAATTAADVCLVSFGCIAAWAQCAIAMHPRMTTTLMFTGPVLCSWHWYWPLNQPPAFSWAQVALAAAGPHRAHLSKLATRPTMHLTNG